MATVCYLEQERPVPITAAQLAKYRRRVFVETGTWRGDGVQAALDAGFELVYSIELGRPQYERAARRFAGRSQVKLFWGDSANVLSILLARIAEPVTIWLDAHYACHDTALGDDWTPLLRELQVLGSARLRTHTLLIDDMRCWHKKNPVIGFGLEEILAAIRRINPAYTFTREDGVEPNDILVAQC